MVGKEYAEGVNAISKTLVKFGRQK